MSALALRRFSLKFLFENLLRIYNKPLQGYSANYLQHRNELYDKIQKYPIIEMIRDYRVVDKIKGGQGVVAICLNKNDTLVVLKKHHEILSAITPNISISDEAFSAHFSASQAKWGVLQIRNIIRTNSSFARGWGGDVYVETLYCKMGSLADRLKHSPLSTGEAIHHILLLALVIEETHRLGVIHCDIKPGNILLYEDIEENLDQNGWQLFLTDFGSAKFEDEKHSYTGFFTPGYAAPEQFRMDKVSKSSDIWAWGIVALELFGGSRPQTGLNSSDVGNFEDVYGGTVELPKSMPEWLSNIVTDTLNLSPKTRPKISEIIGRLLENICIYGHDGRHRSPRTSIKIRSNKIYELINQRNIAREDFSSPNGVIRFIDYEKCLEDATKSFLIGSETSERFALLRLRKRFGWVREPSSHFDCYLSNSSLCTGQREIDGVSYFVMVTEEIVSAALEMSVRILFGLSEKYALPGDLCDLSEISLAWYSSGRIDTVNDAITCAQALLITGSCEESVRLLKLIDFNTLDTDELIRFLQTSIEAFVAIEHFDSAASLSEMLAGILEGHDYIGALTVKIKCAIYQYSCGEEAYDKWVGENESYLEDLMKIDMFYALQIVRNANDIEFKAGVNENFRRTLLTTFFDSQTSSMKAWLGISCLCMLGERKNADAMAEIAKLRPDYLLANALPFRSRIIEMIA